MALYVRLVKPTADRLIAAVALSVLAPFLAVVTVALAIQNRGNPFFAHARVGRGGADFRVFKFRTMTQARYPDGRLLPDRDRLTPLGKTIRKLSIDELPQLLNILRGEMSLIGPRPLVPEYLPHYSSYHARRHEVMPGVTGLAQVAGRNRVPFSKRFDLDVEYVDNISLRLDISILWRTVLAIIRSSDITMGNDLRQIDDVGVTQGLPDHYFSDAPQERRSKRLWIVNHYASAPSTSGTSGRHFALGRHIMNQGWRTTIIAASTRHPSGRQLFPGFKLARSADDNGVERLWVWSNAYRTGAARLLGMVIFAVNALLRRTTRGLEPPDVVIGSTVHPLAAWAGWRLAKRFDVPFVYEIRDVWPETLIDMGALSSRSVGARALRRISIGLCSRAALVVSPLPGVRRHLDELDCGDVPFLWISNGIEDQALESIARPRHRGQFCYMYLGTLGSANGVESIVDAFDLVWSESSPEDRPTLRIIGDGPRLAEIQGYTSQLACAVDVHFEGRVPRETVRRVAQEADCLVVNLRDLAVYRFGISLNKLFDYLEAAKPIVIATSSYNNPVAEANAGLTVPADDVDAMARAMAQVKSMSPSMRDEYGCRGRRHVLANYTYARIAQNLAAALETLTAHPRRSR